MGRNDESMPFKKRPKIVGGAVRSEQIKNYCAKYDHASMTEWDRYYEVGIIYIEK